MLALMKYHEVTSCGPSQDVFQSNNLPRLLMQVVGGWRRLHNEEFCNFYASPNVIRMIESERMRRSGHVAHMGKRRNAYKILVGKPEGMRPCRRSRCRCEDNIRMDLGETGWEGVD
jgi:hypothetical protein